MENSCIARKNTGNHLFRLSTEHILQLSQIKVIPLQDAEL